MNPKYCDSCGGIIGRDCFNPSECAWITHQQEQQQRHEQEHATQILQQRVEELERQIAELKTRKETNDPNHRP